MEPYIGSKPLALDGQPRSQADDFVELGLMPDVKQHPSVCIHGDYSLKGEKQNEMSNDAPCKRSIGDI